MSQTEGPMNQMFIASEGVHSHFSILPEIFGSFDIAAFAGAHKWGIFWFQVS